MPRSRTRLALLVRRTLETYLEHHPNIRLSLSVEQSVKEITTLVENNFSSTRFRRFKQKERAPKQLTQTQYVERLIPIWIAEYPRWRALKDNDEAAWRELQKQLVTAAKRGLKRLGHARLEAAEDYASRACVQIAKGTYTFDVPLNIWIATILKNEILDRPARKDLLPYAKISLNELVSSDLEDSSPRERQVEDERAQQFVKQLGDRYQLEKWLKRLSPLRAKVIVATYFHGQSDAQIANALGKTTGQIHTARHRALLDLRAMLAADSVSESRAQTHQIEQKQNTPRKIKKNNRAKSVGKRESNSKK